jgi:hypothetical protein
VLKKRVQQEIDWTIPARNEKAGPDQWASGPPTPQLITERRPWWRWILYTAAILLAGLITMIIGFILWANPKYRRVGRITVYLSGASIVLVSLAFVFAALID